MPCCNSPPPVILSVCVGWGVNLSMGLVCLPFKPISSSSNRASPITEESHRSRHLRHSATVCRSRFSALIGCQSAVLPQMDSKTHTLFNVLFSCNLRLFVTRWSCWSFLKTDPAPPKCVTQRHCVGHVPLL